MLTKVNIGFHLSFVYTLCKQKPVLTKLRLGKVEIKHSMYTKTSIKKFKTWIKIVDCFVYTPYK